MLGARRVGAPPDTYRKGELEGSPSSFTRDGRELTILIPDVDSKLRIGSVKHKSIKIVKKRSKRVHAIARACAIAVRDRRLMRARARVLHAGAELLLLAVAFEGEFDEAIDQLRVVEAARRPHLRVHADRREAGQRVELVQVDDAAVAGEEEIDAREPRAVDRFVAFDRQPPHV